MQENKAKKIAEFDPNSLGDVNANIFGLPFNFEESEVVLLPVPWEVTVSYSPGTAKGPLAIKEASVQVDLYDPDLEDAWKYGIYMQDIASEWLNLNNQLRPRAFELIRYMEHGGNVDENPQLKRSLIEINEASVELENWVYEQTLALLQKNKKVGVLGGEHSVPLGFLKALATIHDDFGILQIDAHADLRPAYEGFESSHASITYNAMKIDQISKIVQAGIRDISEGEMKFADENKDRISIYPDGLIRNRIFEGENWGKISDEIISKLPQKVYITFDIDGLDPKLCPNTGTPVPGGFSIAEINYLLLKLVNSGRQIIGFDLVEVAPGQEGWNGNVGARVLYKLCNMMVKSSL